MIFSRKPKTNPVTSSKTHLLPCHSGQTVLNDIKNEVGQIRNLVSMATEIYAITYLQTLHNLAQFCQAMPVSEAKAESYGLLRQQLALAKVALKQREKYLLPKNTGSESIAEQAPQWTYAVFAASCLYGLSAIQHDRQIRLFDGKQEKQGLWHPLTGNLFEPNTFYELIWQPSDFIADETVFMASLMGRIIPGKAMRWLSGNALLLVDLMTAITTPKASSSIGDIIREASLNASVSHATSTNSPTNQQILHTIQAINPAVSQAAPGSSSPPLNQPVASTVVQPTTPNPVQVNTAPAITTSPQNPATNANSALATQSQPTSEKTMSLLLVFLETQKAFASDQVHCVKAPSGLFVTSRALREFMDAQGHWVTLTDCLATLASYLVQEQDQFYFSCQLDVDVEEEGVLLKEEALSPDWQALEAEIDQMPIVINLP